MDDASSSRQPPEAVAGKDERRMQVRAYNFWASLLGNRSFPVVADLHPEELGDFGPHSVLLDFTGGVDDPRIAYLGAELSAECDVTGAIRSLSEVPSRSLLTRITDHYMQIIANQAPIGFEAEFVNQRGVTILYRGILLPFSRDDAAIDHIYGVINWKELADQSSTDSLMRQIDEAVEARPAMLRASMPLTDWADGPVVRGMVEPLEGPEEMDLPLDGYEIVEEHSDDAPLPSSAGLMGLGDWLASARELALAARSSEERSRQALYSAIGRAYDFALAAAEAPDEFAELVADAGLKVQDRAPLIPLVKLVFGADYDKTRLTEFATVIAHGQRQGLECGALAAFLAEAPGGLKGLVREERRLRRAESGRDAKLLSRHERLVSGLRDLSPKPIEDVARDSEFTVLVARRLESGEVVLLGEVADDQALLDRAARHLLD
ncbi:hypothetical protein GCM10011494_23200 [Novosphingobium endophyticum]|uniref:PAS domain-containing protein n=2 Tax=Novosphingobium endophyticum TaxID=1955250 RepID=A0A916X4Y9_9SPHN|nr:hypothetical protein GCM10011494_23200 [Novosphingobium endophyticum]